MRLKARVLSDVNVETFQSCFVCWLNSLRDAAKEQAGISAEEQTHLAIDAMQAQTAIADQIVDGEGDCILALKAN